MAIINQFAQDPGPTLATAVTAFCDTLDAQGTRRVYAGTLRALLVQYDPATPLSSLADPATAAAISG